MGIDSLAIIVALILSIVLHEVAHGYAANWLGDPTARLAGRLSPNPLKHIDLVGSILVPGILFFTHAGILFGWAKPVPYNPYNLRNQKWGDAIVAAAGPGTNLLLALIFGIIIRFSVALGLSQSFMVLSAYIVFINILLALFNLIPIPPLDGSKILQSFLPYGAAMRYRDLMMQVERYGIIVLFIGLILIAQLIWPYLLTAVVLIGSVMTGLAPLHFIDLINML